MYDTLVNCFVEEVTHPDTNIFVEEVTHPDTNITLLGEGEGEGEGEAKDEGIRVEESAGESLYVYDEEALALYSGSAGNANSDEQRQMAAEAAKDL